MLTLKLMIMDMEMNATDLLKVAEVELVYRTFVRPSRRPKVTAAALAYNYFLQGWNADKIELVEQFKLMLLNRGARVLGILELSAGGTAGTVVDLRLIYAAALKANACSLILAHNHPSGNLKPSDADIQMTRKIRQAGELLEIAVNDHLIMSAEGFYSFADEGLL
jgi:DNA repair protein RadC